MSDGWDDESPVVLSSASNASSYYSDRGNYGYADPRSSEPIFNQTFENSSFQGRNRGFGNRGRPDRFGNDNNGRQNNRGGNNDGNRQYNRGFDRFGSNDGGRPSNRNVFGNNDGGRQMNRNPERFGGNDSGGQFNRGFNRGENTVTLKVPSRFVGRIIGKGGSKISDLQFESGAKIIVTKEEEDGETLIKLIGSADAAKKAEELIKELTVDKGPAIEFVVNDDNFKSNQSSLAPVTPINWKSIAEESDRLVKEEWAKLPPIKKNFYVELPEVRNMSKSEVEQFKKDNNNIVVCRTFASEGSNKPIPNPAKTFYQAFHNYPEILDEIEKVGFETPSPIQAQAWPILLSGEDMIGIAQTGTGKTLAFLLPALIHIDGQGIPREERTGPSVLVMAPTRELALQIDREVKKYFYRNIKAVCIYGGGSRRDQVKTVTEGVDIIIATPGRLNDLVQAGHIKVQGITYVVLDEADRMLDMGFEPQIRKTMYDIRPDRQTVMTSATWPPGVRRLASSYMVDPIQVYVGSLDLAAVHSVTQTIVMMPDDEDEKFNTFVDFVLNLQPDQKVIAFCGKKARANFVASELIIRGIDCQSIHGDLEQCDREQALIDISNGSVQILIATDVASRGIDIEDITHVINYDFPRNIEEYVHRVGRTGRAGRSGDSISYFTRADWSQAKELIEILEEADQYVPEELVDMSKRYEAWKKRKDEERAFCRGNGGGGGGGGGGGQRRGGRRW